MKAQSLRSPQVAEIAAEVSTRLSAADPLPAWAWSARAGGSRVFMLRRGPFILRLAAGELTAVYVLRPYTARVIQANGVDGFVLDADARAIAVGSRRGPWVVEVVEILGRMLEELRRTSVMPEERAESEIDAARDSIARWQVERHANPQAADTLGAEPAQKRAAKA